ncbi:hypothetical protein EVAR_13754_1 [Eumeta japonica]|uniref:Uncharacterized protein n=1 Tax=Eumeta variegata TaxID=151549 RepID=A0A4C1UCY4_EUMVA|nr:hypothetical protein EVAR_13754_1 [Eumeta japonica]
MCSTAEQQARQCNIEIANLPDGRGESLICILDCLGNEIKCLIRAADLVSVHRVPHADQKTPKPKNLMVKFTSIVPRNNIISAYRAGKGFDSNKLLYVQLVPRTEYLLMNT